MLDILLKDLDTYYKMGTYYYSLSTPIHNSQKAPFDYFKVLNKTQREVSFYFETPDKKLAMVGIGDLEVIFGGVQDISNWRRQLPIISRKSKIPGVGPFIFGSYPFFDELMITDTWGEFGRGCHILPQMVMTLFEDQLYLTINVYGKDLVSLRQDVMAQWELCHELSSKSSVLVSNQSNILSQSEIGVDQWLETVDLAVGTLKSSSQIEKIVLAREMIVEKSEEIIPSDVLEQLKEQQANTFFFSLSWHDNTFIGATPERFLKASDDEFVTASIAGSTPRGKNKIEDDKLANALLNDKKNRYEHSIVLSRIKEDLSALTGNKVIESEVSILKNKDIQHLHVPLSVKRSDSVSFSLGIETLHPTPALGGEPKNLSSEWLKNHEPLARGLYGAPIGWQSLIEDNGEYVVGIRSALINGKQARLFAGCGIVADSEKELEKMETLVKFKPMLRGLGGSVS